ncbi:Mu transposase C-terminal domain-containing protein [Paenibacillus typhae]|uniref:Mu transposase, C-terminal n=1 Tax=Paenibacillus typhae TaxID=1174501 RepID=A0A1G8QP45_9BACL|nr:Mu transposase C-terminal domain-containing protein [Paenibacillus typhae]SDJ06466.1 Mu transposase, C-terminal [Paenibacillus typhae]
MQTDIYPNSILEFWPDIEEEEVGIEEVTSTLLRVLWVNQKVVVTIDIFSKTAQPEFHDREIIENEIIEGNIQFTEYVIPRMMLPDSKINEKDRSIRDKVWGYLEEAVTGKHALDILKKRLRGIIIEEISEKYGVSKTLVRMNLRKYWQRGMRINSLLPDFYKCGGKGVARDTPGAKVGTKNKDSILNPEVVGIKITKEIKRDHFQKAIDRWYKKRDKRTLYEVYLLMLEAYYKAGIDADEGIILVPTHERPTFRQFYYWHQKERDSKDEYQKRYGQRKFNLKNRAIEGTFDEKSFGPGSLYQIDATVGNVYLVNRKNRNWFIGRPIIYFVVDVFSRLIAGLYVGLEGPSWIGAALALENAASDKVEYCKRFGIDLSPGEWPSFGLPERLTTDRGEYVGNKPTHLIKTLNVKPEHLPAYRPDWKPFVEKAFDVSNQHIVRWIPGGILERMHERGDQKPAMTNLLDIHEFETILIEYVRYHNKHYMPSYRRNEAMIAKDVVPTPISLWDWGRKNSLGSLHFASKDELRMNLLPSRKSRFTASGIKFNNNLFTCETAENENWRFHARNKEKIVVEFSFDPRDTSRLFLRHEDGKFEECYKLNEQNEKFVSRKQQVRWEEELDIIAYEARMARRGKDQNVDDRVNYNYKVKGIVNTSKASNKPSGNKPVQVKDVKEHRRVAKQQERDERSWKLEGENNEKVQSGNVIDFPIKEENVSYVPSEDNTDLLWRALEEEE